VKPLVLVPRGFVWGDLGRLVAEAEVELLEADYEHLEWQGGLRTLKRPGAGIVAIVASDDRARAWLAEESGVVAVLSPPLDAASVTAALRAAHAATQAFEFERASREREDLLNIAQALSSERDIGRLERLIVRKARELTAADAGSLYVVEEHDGTKQLRFAVAQTGPNDEGTMLGSLLPLTTGSVAGFVASSGESVRIADVYEIPPDVPYTFNRAFDDATGYRSKSMLCVPMRTPDGGIVGVLQLINRKPRFDTVLDDRARTERLVLPFDEHDERLLLALAAQAAVAIKNAQLLDSIRGLFEQFVHASVKAIEVRDVATQGHSARVSELSVAQATTINGIESGPLAGLHFTDEQIRELRYAAILHDFGKVAVPEYIFGKSKKLPDGRLDTIRLRFLLAIEQATDEREREELRDLLARIEAANEPAIVDASADAALQAALARRYRDLDGPRPLLDPKEYEYLTIPRGSLSEEERRKMQDHVTQSYLFLREIPWSQTPWRNVPEFAYAHHEHLDGTGYPRRLAGDAIPPQVRMLTIADIFDALTAGDRPYKRALSVERALEILDKEFAQRGKVDPLLLDVFITKRVYEAVVR